MICVPDKSIFILVSDTFYYSLFNFVLHPHSFSILNFISQFDVILQLCLNLRNYYRTWYYSTLFIDISNLETIL